MEMDIQTLKGFIFHSLIHLKIFMEHLLCSLCVASTGNRAVNWTGSAFTHNELTSSSLS